MERLTRREGERKRERESASFLLFECRRTFLRQLSSLFFSFFSFFSVFTSFLLEKKKQQHARTDVENTSFLSHTTLGAKVRPLLTRKPFLVGGFFNTGAFGAVMAYARLHEHKRALDDEKEKKEAAKPKSRQERRQAEAELAKKVSITRREVEESMRKMGAKVA